YYISGGGILPSKDHVLSGEAWLQQYLHVLHLEKHKGRAHRILSRALRDGCRRLLSPEFLAEYARHPPRLPRAWGAACARDSARPCGDAIVRVRHLRPALRARRQPSAPGA